MNIQTLQDTPRWGRTEIRVKGPASNESFKRPPLVARFHFQARTVSAEGFYDGDGYYAVRFMPDEVGEWSWELEPLIPGIEACRGTLRCTEALEGVRGPVRIGAPTHFAYEDGSLYRPIGTTAYAWNNQDDELAGRTLATLAAGPFNKIRMCVFPKHYDFNLNEPPLYPFVRRGLQGGGAEGTKGGAPEFVTATRFISAAPVPQGLAESRWDFSTFDPAFFRRMEGQIDSLAKLGIEADLILFHPYDRWGFADMGEENDTVYLQYLVARLSSFRNIWWSFANEWDLMPWKTVDQWDRLFKLVQEKDPYGHLRSIHNCRPFYDHGKPWVTHCSVQHNDVSLVSDWMAQYGKPVVVDECKYEGNLGHRWGDLTAQEMTNRFWEGFCRGAYIGHGETYLRDRDEIWWARGGDLIGGSPSRIAFLRRILEEGPAVGLQKADLGKAVHAVSGVGDEYFLVYLGIGQPAYKTLTLPEGGTYRIDIIDVWNMTVTEAEGSYRGACRVELPTKPYMALRIRKV